MTNKMAVATQEQPAATPAPENLAAAKPKRQKKPLPKQIHYPFWFGGSASSFAACVTHPLDLGTSLLPCCNNTHNYTP
jgi:solute carrier family 25 (mitochondrial dicarboxylate transporter), member 10